MCEMRSHEVVCVPPLSANNLGESPAVCDVRLFSEEEYLLRLPPDFNLGYILKVHL